MDNKKLEVVQGNGDNLDVSPVYKHLSVAKPKIKSEKEKQNIVVPKVGKKKKKR